jgi:hypothetical protein
MTCEDNSALAKEKTDAERLRACLSLVGLALSSAFH